MKTVKQLQEISAKLAGDYAYKVIKNNVEKYGVGHKGEAPPGTPKAVQRNRGLNRAMTRVIKAGMQKEEVLIEGAHDFRASFDIKSHPTVAHVQKAINDFHAPHVKRGEGGAYDHDTQLAKIKVVHKQTPHKTENEIHDHHLDHTEKWGPLHAHKGDTHWHVGGWIAEEVLREHVDVGNHPPTTYLDKPHLVRLNTILTQITGKLFVSLQVYVDAVRATLDFHGFKLPHLDCEQVVGGPNLGIAYGDLKHGAGFENNRNVPTEPPEFEYVFQLKYYDITGGLEPEEYLYMCANQVKIDGEGNFWETYAQIVNAEELEELTSMDSDPRNFPDVEGGDTGETEYLKLQRHTNTTGTSPEVDEK